jgi:hypothetical protein
VTTTPTPPPPIPPVVAVPNPDGNTNVPVFGKSAGPVTYKQFGLEVEEAATEKRWVEYFEVRTDVDGGSLVHMLSQPDGSIEQAQAAITFLGQQLRDTDGPSVEWSFPAVPEEDPDRPGKWLRGDPTGDDPEGAPLYRWHDGALLTEAELAQATRDFDGLRTGSSKRRFAYLSDTRRYRYRYEAIEELAKWLTEGVARRPTLRPAPSGHGPQSTKRTSRAR